MEGEIGLMQKALVVTLYLLVMVSFVLSIMAMRNVGKEGFERCVQKKCETVSEEYCSKFREVNNCCQGAGGRIEVKDDGYVCVFD
jgi:hypothetical protein